MTARDREAVDALVVRCLTEEPELCEGHYRIVEKGLVLQLLAPEPEAFRQALEGAHASPDGGAAMVAAAVEDLSQEERQALEERGWEIVAARIESAAKQLLGAVRKLDLTDDVIEPRMTALAATAGLRAPEDRGVGS